MKNIIIIIVTLFTSFAFSQKDEQLKKEKLALQKSNDFVYEANTLINEDAFTSAEMEYRKAISERPSTVVGAYNLGNAYYKNGAFNEALYRHKQAARNAVSRLEKHKAFHNIGNILMQNKQCKEAVEAFKSALRNDPTDDESRYNLALAKECAEQQGDGEDENEDKDKNKNQDKEDKKDKDENQKDEEGEDKDKPEDEGDKEKKDGDQDEDKDGKPKDDKKNQGKGDNKDKQKPQPKPGQLSPQQIKNLLEAMNNQEQKVQEKINAKKQKGVKIKTDKDW
jgi:tetratricopeptide (TPR) repeat protein